MAGYAGARRTAKREAPTPFRGTDFANATHAMAGSRTGSLLDRSRFTP